MWWLEVAAVDKRAISGPELQIAAGSIVSADAVLDATSGPIVIGQGTRVCPGAILEGPITIGSGCLIGNGAFVRGSTIIGDGTRIGFGTEVKNARIGQRVMIGPQCFVADSLVEDKAYLGAQVRTSNHRLDGATVEVMVGGRRVDTGLHKLGCWIGASAALGIQVIVLPGREIAPGSQFAPRITIERNLPVGRYRLKQALETY